MADEIEKLIKKEGWKISRKHGQDVVEVLGKFYPAVHPFSIWSKIYREEEASELKYQALKRMHDLMWPEYIKTWNYWDERRFRAHCEGYNYITYAGGAGTGKSNCAARLALLFWLADPAHRTVIVASTTLESLNSRIFGYCVRFLSEAQVPVVYTYRSGMPPKVLFNTKDKIHGIYALAAKRGDDDKAIRDIIGRHPERGMLVILDEATDMPVSLLKALPNLESGAIFFQVVAIGNSLSKFDLHGSLSTPEDGWKSIDPMKVNSWKTTQKNGICLFFSCYDSPAIYETDQEKRVALSKFFITKNQIDQKIKLYGANSDSFWRFVLGYWRDDGSDDTVISKTFLGEFHVDRVAEWSGIYPFQIVGGLDIAFSTGGDRVILRLGILGQETSGKIVLDFRKEELIFPITILANLVRDNRVVSAEMQIADGVIEVLKRLNCPLCNIAVDVTGQGRAIGDLIKLRAGVLEAPIKVYSTKIGLMTKSFDVVVKNTLDLWTDVRDFIQTDQLRGIDAVSLEQLSSRLIETQSSSGKRVLESKAAYKSRMGSISPSLAHSPDEADSLALTVCAAKLKFGFTPGQSRELRDARQSNFELEKWHAKLFEDKARIEEAQHLSLSQACSVDFSSDIHDLVLTHGRGIF